MSTPTVDTDGAAGICIHISETGTYLGASSDGASQASNTTSHAQEHRVKLEAKMSEYGKIIAQLPTNNAPVVGLGLASSTVPDSASHPKGPYPA